MCNQYKVTNISVYIFLDGCYASLCAALNFCDVARHEGKSLYHGVSALVDW
jgi:hypothetical protein